MSVYLLIYLFIIMYYERNKIFLEYDRFYFSANF